MESFFLCQIDDIRYSQSVFYDKNLYCTHYVKISNKVILVFNIGMLQNGRDSKKTSQWESNFRYFRVDNIAFLEVLNAYLKEGLTHFIQNEIKE